MARYVTQHINEFNQKDLEKLGQNGQLIDVRTPEEYELGHVKHSILHPVDDIESFNKEQNKTYYIYCKSGNRSAKASDYLADQGYDVVNLDGGYTVYAAEHEASLEQDQTNNNVEVKSDRKMLDLRSLQCPGPIVNISREIKQMDVGQQLEAAVSDFGFLNDIQSWTKQTGHTLVKLEATQHEINAVIQKEEPKSLEVNQTARGTTIVLFSGELDKAMAAMIIANGAKAAGKDVTIFFTFWGLNALKKIQTTRIKKQGMAKMFDLMLPKSPERMPLSKMNMFGLGNLMMRYVMKKKGVNDLPSLIDQAVDQGVKLVACTMSMDVMGIAKEELRDDVEYGGVGTYIGDSDQANHNLFI